MTLRNMEVFMAVVQSLNMSKAATKLHIAQPTISQTIREIEQEYSTLLFDRIGKKLYLTEEGKALAAHVQTILDKVRIMNDSMTDIIKHPIISVGATISIGQSLLAPSIQQFEKDHPDSIIHATVDNTAEIENLLLKGKLDIALVEGTVKNKELVSTPLCSDRLVLVCTPGHTLAGYKTICLKNMLPYPFLVREEGSGTRELFQKALDDKNVQIHIKWTAHSFDSILSGVLAKQGISVMSHLVVKRYLQTGELIEKDITDVQLTRDFSLVYHKTRVLTPAMKAFAACFSNLGGGNPLF